MRESSGDPKGIRKRQKRGRTDRLKRYEDQEVMSCEGNSQTAI